MMHVFYGDDTYGKVEGDNEKRIHLFGGIVISREVEPAIIQVMRDIKSKYTHPNMPIKWNFRDDGIKKKYAEFNRIPEYEKMLPESRIWRLDLFKQINDLKWSLIVACADGKVEKDVKIKLQTYCFENILMRLGLDAKVTGGHWQCVLDWPPSSDTKPYDRAYYQLFHSAKASSPNPAYCGPLEPLGFSHSLHYTRCNHSPLMQLTNLLLGATRDHIEASGENCVGSEAVSIFYRHFRNRDGQIPGFGVTAQSSSESLSKHINKIFNFSAA
jgi:hypothetical protein